MSDILEIRMQSNALECYICGEESDCGWSVPIFNGDIVSNDFPDYMWHAGGGGQAVCEDCYRRHERGEVPTFDHYYIRPAELIHGAGI